MKKASLLFIIIGSIFLSACFDGKHQSSINSEPTHTVSWFLTHNSQLDDTLRRCSDNPAEFQKQPNCINAQQAANQRSGGELHPIHIAPNNMPNGKGWN
ncbi:EexN family lipoprotein [Shewanella sp. 202IG2-18]|uniref:EexN family lipoprotein n=1 Tax=Parashewanella hymeniacidonis TaxID=2807618 RepID=UPI00195F423F|nr:EexN family lipoprotein [Parashewanella hymeniacidonis]MBM7070727.1 EexN family lipoprotein [Parashewanella hymeniacidonis]